MGAELLLPRPHTPGERPGGVQEAGKQRDSPRPGAQPAASSRPAESCPSGPPLRGLPRPRRLRMLGRRAAFPLPGGRREQVMWEPAAAFAGCTERGPEVEEPRARPWRRRRPLCWRRTMRSDGSGAGGRCCAAPGSESAADCAACEQV